MWCEGSQPVMFRWSDIWAACWRRICEWKVPPHWSAGDWMEELQAQGAAAAWQALGDFDTTRGVPLQVYLRQRVLTSVLTRSRQEWSYALHCALKINADDGRGAIKEDEYPEAAMFETLRQGLAKLAERDRWLIERLFWEGQTEAKVAEKLGISQAAVNKRKCAILRALRLRFDQSEKGDRGSNGYISGDGTSGSGKQPLNERRSGSRYADSVAANINDL